VVASRSVVPWHEPDLVLRLSIGLEDENELWADIERLLAQVEALETATNPSRSARHA
jgi:cysteine-S-conjugate beta-lyase